MELAGAMLLDSLSVIDDEVARDEIRRIMMVQGEYTDTKLDVHKPLSPLVQITSQVTGITQ